MNLSPPSFPWAVYEVARKEFLDHVRTKRIYIIGGLFAAGFLVLTFVFASFTNDLLQPALRGLLGEGADFGLANAAIFLYLYLPVIGGYTFIQLLAIALSSDSVVREWEDKSLFLLLSKPVARGAVYLGKFAGGLVSVAIVFVPVTVVAYLMASAIVEEPVEAAHAGEALLAMLYILAALAAFVSLGLLCSTLTRTTMTGLLLALGAWLILLPLLGSTGYFYVLSQGEIFEEPTASQQDVINFWAYFDPGTTMRFASKILVDIDLQIPAILGPDATNLDVGTALFALVAFTGVCLALGLWIFWRRDYA